MLWLFTGLLAVVAGVAKAGRDICGNADLVKVSVFAGSPFWDGRISWRNKYKPHWLPFRKTLFVWTTDGWHLLGMIWATSLTVAALLWPFGFIGGFLLIYSCYLVSFNIYYDIFLR